MKASELGTLSYDLTEPEAKDAFKLALKASDYKLAFEEVWQQLFRPMFKHGYDPSIEKLVEACGRDAAYALVDALSEKYNEINIKYIWED